MADLVKDGVAALKSVHRQNCLGVGVDTVFADSVDIDAGLLPGRESENRWDYLLGHQTTGLLVALEPHSAKSDQVSRVIEKKAAAIAQLRAHLKPGKSVAKWLWVASGDVQFLEFDKLKIRLDKHGIEFVGRRLLAKHLT